MRFLRTTDYYRLIQPNDLDELLSMAVEAGYDGTQLLIDNEASAIETIKSYLSARYDLDRALSDTPIFDINETYYAGSRVQYHEPAYVTSSTYNIGNRVSYQNKIYECNTNTTTGAWNAAKWDYICLDYALFYITLPYPEFQQFTNYTAGTIVWFSDNYTYTALRNTNGQSLNSVVYSEYGADKTTSTVDFFGANYVEDINNGTYWSRSGSKYTVTGILPTDATKWTSGDNRSALLIEKVIDITLFNLFSAISPRNIPELRLIRYDGNDKNANGGAIGWLKKVSGGSVSANLPEKYPVQGLSIVFGSSAPKSTNTY